MAKHLKVGELHESGGLEVHVVGPDLLAAFFYRFGDIFLFGAFVVPEASNEVVEGFLEPRTISASGSYMENFLDLCTCSQVLRKRPATYDKDTGAGEEG
jgi:hypothetical protein